MISLMRGGEGGKEELTLLGTGTCDITDAGGGEGGRS